MLTLISTRLHFCKFLELWKFPTYKELKYIFPLAFIRWEKGAINRGRSPKIRLFEFFSSLYGTITISPHCRKCRKSRVAASPFSQQCKTRKSTLKRMRIRSNKVFRYDLWKTEYLVLKKKREKLREVFSTTVIRRGKSLCVPYKKCNAFLKRNWS